MGWGRGRRSQASYGVRCVASFPRPNAGKWQERSLRHSRTTTVTLSVKPRTSFEMPDWRRGTTVSEKQVVIQKGVGFLPLLALLFIGLKLGGVINWSWLWVLAPLWAPLAIGCGIAVLAAAAYLTFVVGLLAFTYFKKRKK